MGAAGAWALPAGRDWLGRGIWWGPGVGGLGCWAGKEVAEMVRDGMSVEDWLCVGIEGVGVRSYADQFAESLEPRVADAFDVA